MTLRNLVLLMLVVLALPALAQQPGAPPALAVNGQPLPPGAVVASAGTDVMVLATPYLKALGAQVRSQGNHVEAGWPEGVLVLDAGSDNCSWNGSTRRLDEAVGSLSGDLLIPAAQIARIIGGRVESGEWGMSISRSSGAPPPMAQDPTVEQDPARAQGAPRSGGTMPPGMSLLPSDLTGSGSGAQGQGAASAGPAEPEEVSPSDPNQGQSFPEAGLGGLSQKQGPYESPYKHPTVGSEMAAHTVTAPDPSATASPGYRPPRAVVTHLDARRIMTFHLSSYELKAKVRNEGTVALVKPFQVQFLARGERNNGFELLEAFLVRALGPGEEVQFDKTADGHQFQSLQGMNVTFKVVVIEDAPPRPDSRQGPAGPATVEGSSMEKGVSY